MENTSNWVWKLHVSSVYNQNANFFIRQSIRMWIKAVSRVYCTIVRSTLQVLLLGRCSTRIVLPFVFTTIVQSRNSVVYNVRVMYIHITQENFVARSSFLYTLVHHQALSLNNERKFCYSDSSSLTTAFDYWRRRRKFLAMHSAW